MILFFINANPWGQLVKRQLKANHFKKIWVLIQKNLGKFEDLKLS